MTDKYIFTSFEITCKICGSKNIETEDSRGYSAESGSWGSYDFICVDCGNREELINDN